MHPPYRYDEKCERSARGQFHTVSGKYGPHYFFAVRCTSDNLLRIMRTVIEKDPEAIIVIVSDHGSGFGMSLSRSSNSPASLYERYSNLGLWRLPEVCRHMLYPNLSPVNAYPIILACLTGQEPDLIPEAAYYPSVQGTNGQPIWKQVRIDLSRKAATDVTAELRARGILFNK